MNIAILIRTLEAGGAERAASSLANAFASAGHAVTILCLTGSGSFYPISSDVTVRYLNEDSAGGGKRAAFSALRKRFCALRRFVRTQKPDVLMCMSWSTTLYGIACTAGVSTLCVGAERANPYVLDASAATTFLRRVSAVLCGGFVCQTERARAFYPRAARAKIAVIPNAIFNPLVYDISVPNERTKTVAACGRLDRNKGFDVLLDAFAAVHRAYPAYRLCIFGEGACRGELTAQAQKLGIADAVDLPGADPQAIRTIAQSAVFVLSSRSEGMPNALIEAMAVGVPCVSTRCDMGPEELIDDGVNGLLVPVDDAEAMAQAVMRVLSCAELADTLGKNALQVRRTHALPAVAAQWTRYFSDRLGRDLQAKS